MGSWDRQERTSSCGAGGKASHRPRVKQKAWPGLHTWRHVGNRSPQKRKEADSGGPRCMASVRPREPPEGAGASCPEWAGSAS